MTTPQQMAKHMAEQITDMAAVAVIKSLREVLPDFYERDGVTKVSQDRLDRWLVEFRSMWNNHQIGNDE